VSNPYGNNPYGQQPPSNPYGPPGGGSGFNQPAKTDGVSIASLVLSLLCCTSLIGFILGLVGLKRTKGGQRKGRGLAIAGTLLGLLGTLAGVGGGIFVFIYASSFIGVEEAEVGQCANIDVDGDTVSLREKDCSESHNGEIVYVGEIREIEEAATNIAVEMPGDIANITDDEAAEEAICKYLVGEQADQIDPELDWGSALENPQDAEDDDIFLCYVVGDDDSLEESVL
jgi:hypothetical protein